MREALEREFARGGQAYFVHNRIESIGRIGVFLQRLLPGRRIGVAHARMPGAALEEVMHRFHAGEIDLLLATAIVGAGLDVPRANTLIVDRADRFGLADLYQLKGRVGRSDRRAFAYFLVPHEDRITEEAKRRLEALTELSYLGAGFRLALRDLEIRGAGDLLGAEQSGHVAAIGFDLYLETARRGGRRAQGGGPGGARRTGARAAVGRAPAGRLGRRPGAALLGAAQDRRGARRGSGRGRAPRAGRPLRSAAARSRAPARSGGAQGDLPRRGGRADRGDRRPALPGGRSPRGVLPATVPGVRWRPRCTPASRTLRTGSRSI